MPHQLRIIGDITTFNKNEQLMLICYYHKCRAYQALWQVSASMYNGINQWYVIIAGAILMTMSVITQMMPDNATVRDVNTVISAVIGFTMQLSRTEMFNYVKLSALSNNISDQFRDLAVRLNKNLMASVPEENAYHKCIDLYTEMEAREYKIMIFASLWAKIYYRNTDDRLLPAILGGDDIIMPDSEFLETLKDNLEDVSGMSDNESNI